MFVRVVFAGILACCLIGISAAAVFAEGATLQLSPVRQSLMVSPGKTGQVLITVSNPTSRSITLQPSIEDFTTFDADGTPALVAPSSAGSRSFKQFVQPLGQVAIPPEGDKEVKLQISVPEGATPGGYYGALRFSPVGASDTTVNASAASLILLSVPGNVKELLTLDSFTVTSAAPKLGNYWFSAGKANATFSFNNQGDVHEAPVGQLYVKRGSEVVSKVDFNQTQPRSSILPGSHRSWQLDLEIPDEFGKYTVGGVFTYGGKNQTIEISQTYWVIPLVYLIGGGIGLLLLCMLGVAVALKRPFTKRRSF